MKFGPGARLGAYEIVEPLGEGGMGEVYRARDPALQRDVAVKLIHPQYCDEEDRVARFRREARALAALNHPNVAGVYELDECDDVCLLVMELVPGDTLGQLISRERLSLPDALRLHVQIAAALEAAHDKGIVHRDLKPANIKVTPDGVAKVLDFGLAKALQDDSSRTLAGSPTLSTGVGVILGTAAYMSPEQARGKPVDRRADVWAFGCVLFETLSGQRPFSGETMSDTIAGILEREPDWDLLPRGLPPAIQRLLRRCLEKDPQRRLRDMGDARLEIEEVLAEPPRGRETREAVTAFPRAGKRLAPAAALVGAGVAIGLVVGLVMRRTEAPVAPQVARFAIPLTAEEPLSGLDFPALALSPDGSHIAYVAARGGRTHIFLRPLSSVEATALGGTADAVGPFFSPDSQWIGFFADGRLKKVPVAGGPVVTVTEASGGFGGAWGSGDTIVFSSTTGSPLFEVPAAGGTASRVTTFDTARGEFSHRWPELLPDGKTVVFAVGTVGSWDDAEIVAQSLTSGERQTLIKGGTYPRYLPTGHLLYARGGAVLAVPFDAARLAVQGSPRRVLDSVLTSADGAAQVSASRSGAVAYVRGNSGAERRLVSLDRSGAIVPFAAPPRAYATPRASPDGRRIALTITSATEDVWVYDVTEGSLRQLTFEAENSAPIWSADGQHLTFSSNRGGARNLYTIRADGTGAPERLTTSANVQVPGSWSADGSQLAFVEHHPETGRDIWLLRSAGRQVAPFIRTPSDESAPRFSPDGRWVAYVSNESGQNEIYVAPSSGAAHGWQVSSGGGTEPAWSPDGRELIFRAGERLTSAPVLPGREFRTGRPRAIVDDTFARGTLDAANYDIIARTGQIIVVRPDEQRAPHGQLHLVLNWFETLR